MKKKKKEIFKKKRGSPDFQQRKSDLGYRKWTPEEKRKLQLSTR